MITPAAADPRVRFGDLLAAEWIKLWSLRSTRWVLGAGLLLVMAIAVQKSTEAYQEWPVYRPLERAHFDPMTTAFSGLTAIIVMIGSGVLGALVIVGEYSTGLIRTTMTAVPSRHRVIAAKAAVLATVMLVVGAALSLGTFAVGQMILSGRGIALTPGDPGVAHVLVANGSLAPVSALTGMGLGALLRHSAGTVAAVCAVLVIAPMAFRPTVHQWANDLYAWFPFYDWLHCLSLRHPRAASALPTFTGSWIAFALWPLIAFGLAVVAVRRRDL
ncbi:ABC transporter permease subunit [Actinomadura barringtoniae]|uniref:ABC transporter permease subunit n=1 Tax=Actinomadura barringtoniae TaxID=1427535 RepID=A0A939PFT7_9ACTN|nr:ABC transporter permease subunit [Actinomadura barringtoniae]MBO2452067.1 ABC transporter permease subunit [Actinomadura barringtoniae]